MGNILKNKRFSEAPLYAQIVEDLQFKILSGEWLPGDKIPSEMTLCETYHVSRITIRKSIEELVNNHFLRRERAKGTFVCDFQNEMDEHYTVVPSFTNEMKELGKTATTSWADISVVKADRKISTFLNVDPGTQIMCLKRIRGTEKHIFGYFVTYFTYFEKYSLDSKDYYDSFYQYLSQFGITVNHVNEYIEAILPSQEVQERLQVDRFQPILKRVRMTQHVEGSFREYSENYYIGNQYRYYVMG